MAKVSQDAGEYLHWSGDSKRLHWSLGPELFTRELKDAFRFMDGAPEKLPEPPATGVDIGFDDAADVPEGTVALVGGRVITMKGDEVIEDGVVVVNGNAHRGARAARGQVEVPAGREGGRREAGRRSCPGSSTCTGTGPWASDGLIPEQSWVHDASLAFGVTTMHDPSNDAETCFAASGAGARRGCSSRRASSPRAPSSTARRAWIQGADRVARRRALAPAADEGGGGVQREELQPAAARPAPEGASRRRASCR